MPLRSTSGLLSYNESVTSADPLRLTCPRISPQWRFAATLALVKPKPYTKEAIAHADARQCWPRASRRIIQRFLERLPAEVRGAISVDFPAHGENRLIVDLLHVPVASARLLAVRLSRELPNLWFVLGDLYVRDGEFFRRWGKYKLELVRTKHVRLRRAVRFGFYGDLDHAIASARRRTSQSHAAQSDR